MLRLYGWLVEAEVADDMIDFDDAYELYPLTDFKGLNKLSSICKSYRNGQFGAVPEIYV
jgi:hypothetical protein